MKNYTELITLPTLLERYNYLKLDGAVGEETFGWDRYMNQRFYSSSLWKRIRRDVILRDNGCELGVEGYEIQGPIHIHHINPVSITDLINEAESLTIFDNLICCSALTHKAIHYGNKELLPSDPIIRKPDDTCPWKH